MAKLGRIKQEIFAIDSLSTQTAEFGTTKDTPVYTKDASVIQNSNFKSGWDSALLNNEAPYREDRNGVDLAMTRQLAYIYETGTPEYNEETNYCLGAECKVIGTEGNFKIYSSKVEDNLGNPTRDISKWTPVFDTESAGVSLTTEVPFYQNAGGNLEEVSSGVYKVPVGSKFTLANGETFVRNDEPQVDFSGRSDGDYYVFVDKTRNCVPIKTDLLYIQKENPNVEGSVWFNPYKSPYTSKKNNNGSLVNFPFALSNTVITVDSSATPILAFPLMTGENLPAGEIFETEVSDGGGPNPATWEMADGDDATSGSIAHGGGDYLPATITRFSSTYRTFNGVYIKCVNIGQALDTFKFQYTTDGTTWLDASPTYTETTDDVVAGKTYLLNSTYRAKGLRAVECSLIYTNNCIYIKEFQPVLVAPYTVKDIGNRTAYTEIPDITPVSGVSFDVLSSINGGGWTATSDGVLYVTIGMGNTVENRIYIDGVQIAQIISREDDSHGNVNSCTTVILHKGQVVTLGTRPLAGAIFLPARKGSFE